MIPAPNAYAYVTPYEPSRGEYPKAVAVWGDKEETHLIAILRTGLSPWAIRDGFVSIDGHAYTLARWVAL